MRRLAKRIDEKYRRKTIAVRPKTSTWCTPLGGKAGGKNSCEFKDTWTTAGPARKFDLAVEVRSAEMHEAAGNSLSGGLMAQASSKRPTTRITYGNYNAVPYRKRNWPKSAPPIPPPLKSK